MTKPPLLARVGWLVFLPLPLVSTLLDDPSTTRAVLVTAGFLVFFVTFGVMALGAPWEGRSPGALAVFGLQTAIAVALTTLDGWHWGLLFIFLASAIGIRLGPRFGIWPVVAIVALCAVSGWVARGATGGTIGFATSALGVGWLLVVVGRLHEANRELAEAREELAEHAVAQERLRFARDLHDLLGQSLSVIALKAQLAGRLLDDRPREARTQVNEIGDVARHALTEVRDAVGGYRRPTVAGELAGARMALEAAAIDVSIEDATTPGLDPERAAVLAWAVREGTTNVIRHSGARTCSIVVRDDGLEIADDGRGAGAAPAPKGNGLTGLRERVERLHGSVDGGGDEDGGYRLRVGLGAAG